MGNGEQMQEKIGKVVLDYRFYPGEDQYSDGGIEDRMLELAKEYGGSDYNKVIGQEMNWPVLYHFSHVRRNIVEWFPMTGQEHVLEVGAGPGAITGVLAAKAKDVTCIDLSKRRSLINAYRNRDHGNIRILVGNFQDVAGHLEDKFDIITLIGVFEYAQFSIQSKQPFVDYLLALKKLLAPGGRILIAIENRLGLKYWAGATEDHTGIYFEGIEGYPTTDYVRTFAKPELEGLFQKAGLGSWEFYYPYPDYKLPERIYSDRYLPRKGELNRNKQNFDRERMQVFCEERAYDSLIDGGLYPLYANSFLAIVTEGSRQEASGEMTAAGEALSGEGTAAREASGEMTVAGEALSGERAAAGEEGWRVCYSKYSNERSETFRIRTDILENSDGKRVVRKCAADRQAGGHIRSIYEKYQELSKDLDGTGIALNRCRMEDGDVYLEWLDGKTLEEELDELLFEGRQDEVVSKIRGYFSAFGDCEETFRETQEFCRIFGETPFPGAAAVKNGGNSHTEEAPGPQGSREMSPGPQDSREMLPPPQSSREMLPPPQGSREMLPPPQSSREMSPGPQGSREMLPPQKCRKISDIDMIFSNVILTDRGYELIDYEWTFAFPVPVKFLLYRCIHYYLRGNTRREELLGGRSLYEEFGITEQERSVFASMESHFQQYMLGDYQPAWKLYDMISDGVVQVLPLVQEAGRQRRSHPVKVYFDCGNGFSHENSRQYQLSAEKRRNLTIELPEGTKAVQVNLCKGKSIVRIAKLEQSGEAVAYRTNGNRMPNGDYVFDSEEAKLMISHLPGEGRPVELTFYAEPIGGIVREAVLAQDGRIRWMEQTKAWRLYRKARKLLKKGEC